VTPDHDEIDELLAGYALRSLTDEDAARADRVLADHVPGCEDCRATLVAFRELAADLALDADPVAPPEALLPRLHRELGAQPARRRGLQVVAVAAGVAAVVGFAGLSLNQGIRARSASARAEDLRGATEMALRDDANRVPVGPVQELSAPGVERFYVLGSDVPSPPSGSVYAVWVVAQGQPTFVEDFLPEDGRVFLVIPFEAGRYDELWISVEPGGTEPASPTDIKWRGSISTPDGVTDSNGTVEAA
jgi:Anti-sigma-K factor rskA